MCIQNRNITKMRINVSKNLSKFPLFSPGTDGRNVTLNFAFSGFYIASLSASSSAEHFMSGSSTLYIYLNKSCTWKISA